MLAGGGLALKFSQTKPVRFGEPIHAAWRLPLADPCCRCRAVLRSRWHYFARRFMAPESDKPNTRNLPLSGSVAVRWTDASEKFWVEGRVLAATREDRITSADQALDAQRIPTNGTPGYLVTSLRAGWRVNANLDLIAGVENVTDEDYRIHGSGLNEAGVGGIFGVKVLW